MARSEITIGLDEGTKDLLRELVAAPRVTTGPTVAPLTSEGMQAFLDPRTTAWHWFNPMDTAHMAQARDMGLLRLYVEKP